MRRVSVALATYNGEPFLGEMLASIAAQNRRPDQIVVSDDGSTDRTVQVATDFAGASGIPTLVIANADEKGVWGNFFSAFNAADGDIICYADQDDAWHPAKVETILSHFSDPDVRLVLHRSRICDGDLNPTGELAVKNPHYGRLRFPVDATTVRAFGHQLAFDRATLDLMNEMRPRGGNNFDTFIPAAAAFLGDIVVLPEGLVDFRRHAGALTGAGKAAPSSANPPDRSARLRTDYVRVAQQHRAAAASLPQDLRLRYRDALQRNIWLARTIRRLSRSGKLRLLPAILKCLFSSRARFSNERLVHRLALMSLASFRK